MFLFVMEASTRIEASRGELEGWESSTPTSLLISILKRKRKNNFEGYFSLGRVVVPSFKIAINLPKA